MRDILLRDVPGELYEILRLRAASHHCSIASEVKNILQTTLTPQKKVKLGDLLTSISREAGITEEEGRDF